MALARAFQRVVVVCGVVVFGFCGSEAASPAAAQGPAIGWDGLYAGLHGGYGGADLNWTSNYPYPTPATPRPTAFDQSDAIWGGQLGVQLQRGNLVFGVEASLSGGFDRDDKGGVNLWAPGVGVMSARVNSLVLLTGRVGHSWGSTLGYLKAGYAAANIKLTTDDNVPGDFISSSRQWYDGWVLGAGVEYLAMPNVVLGLEYNYGSVSGSANTSVTTMGGGFINTFRSNVDLDIHTLLARLSLKFDFVD